MKQLIKLALLVKAFMVLLTSMSSCQKTTQNEEIVSIYLTYTITTDNGREMPGTKATSVEVFDEFYQKIKSGELVAPNYNLTFTEKSTGAIYTVTGNWAGKDMVTLRTGSYKVVGTSTAIGENIQEKCSLKFEDDIIVDVYSKTITLKANYDCSLIIFSDASIAKLSNFNGISSTDLFKFDNFIYAFIHTKLYADGKQDQSYLEGRHTNETQFKIYTGHLIYEIGKFYVYNDINASFDLEKMEEGGAEGFPVNLSKLGTANCYIVSFAGAFKFKADVKGNSAEPISGNPTKAEILWESFGTSEVPSIGEIIPSVSYNESYIYFNTPQILADGNAVIVLKDQSNNILWSWHIWICNGYNPSNNEHVYGNNAGTMMDRNLGALTNEKGNVKNYGLYYQWGRKDPFVGDTRFASSSLTTFPRCVSKSSSTGTISYSIANPDAIIYGGNSDWANATDNSRWEDTKTIYDPCPYGWRVATGGTNGVWAIASGYLSLYTTQYDSTLHGLDCSDIFNCNNVWYPCAGIRESSSGEYQNRDGDDMNIWSCNSVTNNYAYFLDLDKPNIILTSAGNNVSGSKSYARNVRCQKINMY